MEDVRAMAKRKKTRFIDVGRVESEKYEASAEVREEFAEAAKLASGGEQLIHKLREHHSRTPAISGGDLDAAWDRADAGEETVGGSAPTPDQDVVEELGKAVGLRYGDDEPLHTAEKIEERDRHRWELNPASSEDYRRRVNHEGE
jgi:hypothetical protein